jgi:hypothetical protein
MMSISGEMVIIHIKRRREVKKRGTNKLSLFYIYFTMYYNSSTLRAE